MQITCGIDIIEIDRIKETIEKMGEKFLQRVYTKNEILYCESKNIQKYQHYAARFAAKEAALKAMSKQLSNKYEIGWNEIEVTNNIDGRPILKFHNEELKSIELENIDLSISHCKEYAVANVVVLFK